MPGAAGWQVSGRGDALHSGAGELVQVRSLLRKDPERLGGFHQVVCSATADDGRKVEISSGFGLGNCDLYLSVDGRRVLALDTAPMLHGLIELALEEAAKVRR